MKMTRTVVPVAYCSELSNEGGQIALNVTEINPSRNTSRNQERSGTGPCASRVPAAAMWMRRSRSGGHRGVAVERGGGGPAFADGHNGGGGRVARGKGGGQRECFGPADVYNYNQFVRNFGGAWMIAFAALRAGLPALFAGWPLVSRSRAARPLAWSSKFTGQVTVLWPGGS